MSDRPSASSIDASAGARADQRRVAVATVIGTTIEWYDFFIYANCAALVFPALFFQEVGHQLGVLLSFASIGLSFLFRPLGAFLAGHFGDRIGRRAMLVLTLLLMGGATTLIGILPTYAAIGIGAPILLLLLRIIQGISAGGEWGSAVLMAVEHAPNARRGKMGAFPQIGVPLGMLLAAGVLAVMSAIAPGDAFLAWGWRVPFLISVVLIGVGYVVRRTVEESPVFVEIVERKARVKVPVVQLFRRHWLLVVLAALTFAGNNAAGYMTTGGFLQRYGTKELGMAQGAVLWAAAGSSAVWLLSTWYGGVFSDRIGRRNTYLIGWALQLATVFPLFALLDTGSVWWMFVGMGLFSLGLGLTYGPQAAFFSEIFPASVRFSGIAISYAVGAVIGGAFAPTIAQALVQRTGSLMSVGGYLVVVTLVALVATLVLRDRTGIPLGPDHEAEQAQGATYLGGRSGSDDLEPAV